MRPRRRAAARWPVLAGLAAAVGAGSLPGPLTAQERALVIEHFQTDVRVDAGGQVHVQETIRFDFQGSWNGVYRMIPVKYRTPQGFDYHLVVDLESVTDGEGRELRHEVSREGHYQKIQVWVPGAQDAVRTVRLAYRSPNALRFFDTHDELYWNATGDEWEVPILAAGAEVTLPPGASGLRAAAFTGGYGSTEQAAAIDSTATGYAFRTTRPLGFKEGLTVVVGWDPGVVERPTALDRVASFLRSNLFLLVPLLSLVGMAQLWGRYGRDPERRPVVVRYAPPDGLAPAEAGTLVDHSPDMRDITATMVDLAVRGFLRIEERKSSGVAGWFGGTEYVFHRAVDGPGKADLHPHERRVLDGLFPGGATERELSDLEQDFYKHLPEIKEGIFARLLTLGHYKRRPDQVRGAWLVAGLVLSGLATFSFVHLAGLLSMSTFSAAVAGVLTGLPVVAFAFVMPARTEKGARALEEVRGFQEFMERVESDRYRRMIDSPEMFERYLPYAMALGVEKRWARAFEDLYTEPPKWYSGPHGTPGTFRTGAFVGDLGSFTSRATSAMTSAPRSSGGSGFGGGGGGGSSGGGFGGGGGGGF